MSSIVLTSICTTAICFLMAVCGPTGTKVASAKDSTQEQGDQTTSELYMREIEPLTPVECGRCHNNQFTWLQKKGGKHQFDCTNCHDQFHTYNPRKGNWDEIMPKCQNCHDLPHGVSFPACIECHQQPHAPKEILFEKLEQELEGKEGVVVCAACHTKQGTEFATYPSNHNTEVNCQGCHAEVHGTIPSCLDCHEPHVEKQVYQDCLICHSPHSASNIKQYPEDVPNIACSACHDEPYNNLQANITKHSSLQCATCHESHGLVPSCSKCHGKPHTEGLHNKFADCLICHNDPHNLPGTSLEK